MAAYNAFRNPAAGESATYEDGRAGRYRWHWALYWNTAYDRLTDYLTMWPPGTKLYTNTRGLRNPLARWVDFYVANTWGGALDLAAGDGTRTPSALPIVTENDALRPAIARLWQWSNWGSKRDLVTRYSTVCADAFIRVVDRPGVDGRQPRVFLQTLWPGHVTDAQWDDFGNLKRLEIKYQRRDDATRALYEYGEVMEHPLAWGGTQTRVQTFRNGGLFGYAENGGEAEWLLPYDFLPAVHIPWMDAGANWGATGYTRALPKIDAANALASQLADQIGKTVAATLVAYGIQPGNLTITASDDGVPIIYVPRSPAEARIEPLLANLSLAEALQVLEAQLSDIREDLPELRMSEALRSGMSGEALGRAFSDVLAQVQSVRAMHDAALVRAHMMAIAIAGQGGYHADFAGFDMASYASGALDHAIGTRPVLPRSQEEESAQRAALWQTVQTAVTAGVPIDFALREVGQWDDEKIAALQASIAENDQRKADQQEALLSAAEKRFNAGE